MRDPRVDEAPLGVQALADRGEVAPARVARAPAPRRRGRSACPSAAGRPSRAAAPRPRGTASRTPSPRTRGRRRRPSRARARARAAHRRRPRSAARSGTRRDGARGSRGTPAPPRRRAPAAARTPSPRSARAAGWRRRRRTRPRARAATPTRPAKRLSAGIARGSRRATRLRSAEGVVVQRDVLQPLEPRPARRGGRVGAVVGARQRQRRVREGEQLEVVVGVDVGVELREHVLERQRLVDGVEPEGGHAAQRDGRHHAERAEPDARGQQLVAAVERALASRRRARAPSPRRRVERLPSRTPVPCVPVASAPASDCTSMSPRFGSARPCAVQLAHEPVQSGSPPRRARARPRGRRRARGPGARARAASRPSRRRRENECPAPATRTARPQATAAASSARLPVARARRARTYCPRDQFDHMLRGYRRMSWEPELEELARREALAREMGGEERVARQHRRRHADRPRAHRAPVRPRVRSTRRAPWPGVGATTRTAS